MVANGTIVPAEEVPPPTVPMDYSWARVRFIMALFYFMNHPRPIGIFLLRCADLILLNSSLIAGILTGVGTDPQTSLLYDKHL